MKCVFVQNVGARDADSHILYVSAVLNNFRGFDVKDNNIILSLFMQVRGTVRHCVGRVALQNLSYSFGVCKRIVTLQGYSQRFQCLVCGIQSVKEAVNVVVTSVMRNLIIKFLSLFYDLVHAGSLTLMPIFVASLHFRSSEPRHLFKLVIGRDVSWLALNVLCR